MKRLALLLSLTAGPALAHPHVFIDATAGFTVQDGQVTGLKIVWLYDAFSTLVMYDQLWLDEDGDGKLDATDMDKIAMGETTWEPGYEGDTYLWHGGQKVPMGQPQNGTARMEGDRAEVTFDLPLATPVPADGAFSLKLYDPVYYYSYTIQAVLPDPDACTSALIPFEPSAADREVQAALSALSMEEMPDDPNIGARFADEVVLTCG